MKFLIPLLSFFLGNAKHLFKEPSEALTAQVILKIRSIVVLVVLTIGSLVLSCVGISQLVSKLAVQLDADGGFFWTPGLSLYLGLTVVSVATLLYSLRPRTWIKQTSPDDRFRSGTKANSGRPIENALALLLMDFLEQRKSKRTFNEQNKS